jgi:hypothetical protein
MCHTSSGISRTSTIGEGKGNTMIRDEEIEKILQDKGNPAPRITLDIIKDFIVGEYISTVDKMYVGSNVPPQMKVFTICTLVLKNDFVVMGHSAPASAANFDRELGERLAREDAINKIWQLLGFQLKSELAGVKLLPDPRNSNTDTHDLELAVKRKMEYGRQSRSIYLSVKADTGEQYTSFQAEIHPDHIKFIVNPEYKELREDGETIQRLDTSQDWLSDVICEKTFAFFGGEGKNIYWRAFPTITNMVIGGELIPVLHMRLLLTDLPPLANFVG